MAKERTSLNGKVVAITGGARGIGKATATALVRKGCRVAIGDIDTALAEETAAGLGGGTIALPVDVTDRASFASFLDEAERQLGPLDVVINNAGIMPVTPFAEESVESLHRQIDINLHGVITGTQFAIERHGTPQAPATSSTSPRRPGKAPCPGSRPTRRPSTLSSGSARASRPSCAAPASTSHCVMPTVVNTELTSGVGQRWVKPVEAEDVADAIVEALETKRYDVWVPKENGAIYKFLTLMPRGFREAMGRLMKVDKLMTEVDHGARDCLRGPRRPLGAERRAGRGAARGRLGRSPWAAGRHASLPNRWLAARTSP